MTQVDIDVLQEVAILENSYKYFLETVLILRFDTYYLLMVIHHNKILIAERYNTENEAKARFIKLYDSWKWKETDFPNWTKFFEPGNLNVNQSQKLDDCLTKWKNGGPGKTAGRKGNAGAKKKRRGQKTKDTNNTVESAVCLVLSTSHVKLKEITKCHFSNVTGIDYPFLESMFLRVLGLCPFDYIRRIMILRAALLLEQDQEITIAKLSRLLGFDNIVDFETSFEQYFCIKPARYRQLLINKQSSSGGGR